MNNDNTAIVIIMFISLLLLLLFVRKTQFRKALLALVLAQFFSWPITLMVVYFNLQTNPVRFFPYATKGSLLIAFIFHPSVFVVYCLRYPQKSKFLIKMAFSMILPGFAICTQWLAAQYSNLVYYPTKWVLVGLFLVSMILYHISRKYLDWFFKKITDSFGALNG
jgi:hypothetical protein